MTIALIIVFILLQGLDVMSTLRILRAGGREINPIMKWVMHQYGRETGLIGFKVIATLILVRFVMLTSSPAAIGFVVLYILVVGNNLRVMKKMGLI